MCVCVCAKLRERVRFCAIIIVVAASGRSRYMRPATIARNQAHVCRGASINLTLLRCAAAAAGEATNGRIVTVVATIVVIEQYLVRRIITSVIAIINHRLLQFRFSLMLPVASARS